MQYFFMYILGVLKSPIINFPQVMNPLDIVDRIVHQRFMITQMSPDECLGIFSPQIICISDPNLNDQEFPALEVLERNSLRNDGIFLMYNSFTIYLYIGRQCDPWFYHELFQCESYHQVSKATSEDQLFANVANSTYLTALSNIITQIRFAR
jgi:hypothetical protein